MKIDIHTHTRQCKSGDAQSREIAATGFCEAVQATDVGIIAVTNHNIFDLTQFKDILDEMGGDVQVWPGIELDVVDDGVRGHMLVIVSPDKSVEFSTAVEEITVDSTPDNFETTIEEVLQQFEALGPIYFSFKPRARWMKNNRDRHRNSALNYYEQAALGTLRTR